MELYTIEKARIFIYRNARPLDMARWQYHFENGGKDAVLKALGVYQNEDGGFGHALEPDAWNPNSSPIQTWAATEILREIDFTDSSHHVIEGILRYLASGQDFDGHFWHSTVLSNNDYPHAPWWHTASDSISHNDYNPTACLAGFVIRFADKSSELYTLGCRIVKEACDSYLGQGLLNDMHTGLCYVRLMQYCEKAGIGDLIDLPALKEKLLLQVKSSITQNTAEWEASYICKPSQFFNNRESIFYADNKDIAEYECRYIIKTQPSGKSHISASRRSFSITARVYSMPITRTLPNMSAGILSKHSLRTAHGTYRGAGRAIRKNGRLPGIGGRPLVQLLICCILKESKAADNICFQKKTSNNLRGARFHKAKGVCRYREK